MDGTPKIALSPQDSAGKPQHAAPAPKMRLWKGRKPVSVAGLPIVSQKLTAGDAEKRKKMHVHFALWPTTSDMKTPFGTTLENSKPHPATGTAH